MEVKLRLPRPLEISRVRVVDVADHARAAAHVGDLRFRVALLVVLQVKGRVLEREVGEQPLGANTRMASLNRS